MHENKWAEMNAKIHFPPKVSPPYSFPQNRKCSTCRKDKRRSAGRWYPCGKWVCKECASIDPHQVNTNANKGE